MSANESHSSRPDTDWQVLGELELSTGLNADKKIRGWLTDLLTPLRLHDSLLNKVLTSAQEYALRALQSSAETGHGHVHLIILTSYRSTSVTTTWGFFRIEKIDSTGQDQLHPDHILEFYLYTEGQ